MTYIGSMTLPFERCSYVVKVQCEERGPTGLREAVLLDRALRDGRVHLSEQGIPQFDEGWTPDAVEHDEAFPKHPVSRARRHLSVLEQALRVDERLQRLARFALPV
jgi:hypothetical protein